MAEIMVTAAQLREKKETLQQLNQSLQTQINVLVQAESNVSSMWEGEAKTAFHNAFTQDKAQMDNFKSAIDQYVTALETIITAYETAESTNVNTATTRTYH
ncbi:MAG: WXG100 family type VII secretion target [Lachnospiraceae bacterium]|nr:WXG100 family type VII secretion target [Lachnospiraceae bacterium]